MDCAGSIPLGSASHLAEIREKTARGRVPVTGTFDLTYRCNFRCVHCYVGHLVGQPSAEALELTTAQVKHLLAEAADAGCLLMVLSGGEPLLRSDFNEIYQSAREQGLIVSVFTNASLVGEGHLELFAEYPPHVVEVSVYGSDAATYEAVTRAPGSFDRAMRGIEGLLAHGVRVGLKTMILRENVDDVHAIEALAERLGVPFRLDPVVMARLDGGDAPLEQRVDPELAARIELSSPKRLKDAVDFFGRTSVMGEAAPVGLDGRLYHCGAGVTGFHLDPYGRLAPCVVGRQLAQDATAMGFAAAWEAVAAGVDGAVWQEHGGCADCPDIAVCGYCPGLLALEGADPRRPPEYLCHLGQSRRKMIESCTLQEVGHV